MHIRIITPEKTVLEADDVEHVLLPAENGELGVLPDHIPMVCTMQIGRIRVDLPGSSVDLATSGGFAEVLEDRVTVLADSAERACEIDVDRAQAARERAEERLRKSAEEIDMARAKAALARASNRLRIAHES
ncbi:MAG: F0F1 ATP synthase subunit epsilon [Candidatus Brocadiia bacterium]